MKKYFHCFLVFVLLVLAMSCSSEPKVEDGDECSEDSLVGKIGPAGGYVFYDCDADNNSGNADGLKSSECGWRFLEAAPEDLKSKYAFGYYRPDGLTNTMVGTKASIGSGKSNTNVLVSSMGSLALKESNGAETGAYAAKACDDYSITVNGVVYDDWFLPSSEELALMYTKLYQNKLGSFSDEEYWPSSEDSSIHVRAISFADGSLAYSSRSSEKIVRPIRAFKHTWNAGEITTPATCYSIGEKTYICTTCGKTKTEVVPSGHNYADYKCTRCGDWGKGPTGGYVFYDCDADNNSGNADGLKSSECGWRFLEAAPGDLKDTYVFGCYALLPECDYLKVGTATEVGTGKANTEALVRAIGEFSYSEAGRYDDSEYAAKACIDYSIMVDGILYDDWFLPSKDELNLMNGICGKGSFVLDYEKPPYYWSSSETGPSSSWAKRFGPYYGYGWEVGKGINCLVRPVRAFTECLKTANHSWDDGVFTTEPTCTASGMKEYTCTVCGQVKSKVVYASTHIYVDYKCIVCGLWEKGPSGGFVFYDCDADNDTGNEDGLKSSECGWRYLEAATSNITSSIGEFLPWGAADFVDTETAIGTGYANTSKIYAATTDGSTNIATEVLNRTIDGVVGWFVPSEDELTLMYDNLYKEGVTYFETQIEESYWSSSGWGSSFARSRNFLYGGQGNPNKSSAYRVRPVRYLTSSGEVYIPIV